MNLTLEQGQFYDKNGYLVVKGAFTDEELKRLDRGVYGAVTSGNCSSCGKVYPAPETLYIVEGQYQDDPDLLLIGEHPAVTGPVESLLDGYACLSAFVSYLKTPGAVGTSGDYQGSHPTGHCDYKTYQQAGSSLNWLFAIIPLTDLDEETGSLLVSPGSHRESKIVSVTDKVSEVHRAQAHDIAPLIDAELKRGDLCFMHGFTWHEGKGNSSNHDRYGIYLKYRAVNAPPGCGPQLFRERAFSVFSEAGKRFVPHHGGRSFVEAQLIVDHGGNFLLVEGDARDWKLPGAAPLEKLVKESVTADIIGQLDTSLQKKYGLEIPWMTYIADYRNGDGVRRVYAYQDSGGATAARTPGPEFRWCDGEEIRAFADNGKLESEDADAIHRWETENCVRGVGESMERAKKFAQ